MSENFAPSSGTNGNSNYGSVGGRRSTVPSITTPRKVIYCVHGKPSDGCCKVMEGEVINMENDTEDITSITKENSDTTELGKFFTTFVGRNIVEKQVNELVLMSVFFNKRKVS